MTPRLPLRPLPLALALGAAWNAQGAEPPLRLASHDTLYIEILKPLPLADVETRVLHRKEPALPQAAPDSAGVLKTVPGADVNRNGPLTGLVQYRGLFGERVGVRVDGMLPDSAGPNSMDPPLSLIPRGQLQSITLHRGIAPVSAGPNTFGGMLEASSLQSRFAPEAALRSSGLARFDGSTADRGHDLNLFATLASDRDRAHLALTRERGGDLDTPLGRLPASRYARDQARIGYGHRANGRELGIELRRNWTGKTGTPALPMDIVNVYGTNLRADATLPVGNGRLRARLSGSHTTHQMDNFSLRPNGPRTGKYRLTNARSDGRDLHLEWGAEQGHWKFGLDAHRTTHDAVIHDPTNPAFRVDNFHDVELRHIGLYAEGDGQLGKGRWEAGLRLTRAFSDAGTVDSSMAMMNANVRNLRDRFNATDRSQNDTLVDAVFQYSRPLSADAELIAGIGHKMRSPSYQQRYLWLPLQSTGGLADGHNYVGNPALDPERSWQLELGIDLRRSDWALSPRLFYRRIDDYIQGVPATDPAVIAVSTGNGDPSPLQFDNVAAKLYGLDVLGSWVFAEGWRLDGDIGWIRGERRDIDDALYRIAPPRLNLRLQRRWAQWEIHLGVQAYQRQKRVSATNGEQVTPGHALWSAGLAWKAEKSLELRLDIANLADRVAYDHVGGYNRVMDSIVPVGNRLPGAGRNLQLQLHWRW